MSTPDEVRSTCGPMGREITGDGKETAAGFVAGSDMVALPLGSLPLRPSVRPSSASQPLARTKRTPLDKELEQRQNSCGVMWPLPLGTGRTGAGDTPCTSALRSRTSPKLLPHHGGGEGNTMNYGAGLLINLGWLQPFSRLVTSGYALVNENWRHIFR